MLKCDQPEKPKKVYKIPPVSKKRQAAIDNGSFIPKERKPINKVSVKRSAAIAAGEVIKKEPVAIKPRSEKRTKEENLYSKVRAWYLKLFPECEAALMGCTCDATEVHHMAGRTGWLLTYLWYFLAVCRNCHQTIEAHPTEAKGAGLSLDRITNNFHPINYLKWTKLTRAKNRPQIPQTIIPGAKRQ